MVCTPKVTMTMRELDRLKCVQGVVDRQLKLYQAAERLGLTTRQVRRLAEGRCSGSGVPDHSRAVRGFRADAGR
jgi:hypothetical protein